MMGPAQSAAHNRLRATTVFQKIFRGSKARSKLPRLRAQSSIGAGIYLNCRVLNEEHELWSNTTMDPRPSWHEGVFDLTFNEECEVRICDQDIQAKTDFSETGDKISNLFAEVVVAEFSKPSKPLYSIFDHPESHALENCFQVAIQKMESGNILSLWDGHSTKLRPTPSAIQTLKSLHVKYGFFMTAPTPAPAPAPAPTPAPVTVPGPRRPSAHALNQRSTGLARCAPRTICGMKMIVQGEENIDDLVDRLTKLTLKYGPGPCTISQHLDTRSI